METNKNKALSKEDFVKVIDNKIWSKAQNQPFENTDNAAQSCLDLHRGKVKQESIGFAEWTHLGGWRLTGAGWRTHFMIFSESSKTSEQLYDLYQEHLQSLNQQSK